MSREQCSWHLAKKAPTTEAGRKSASDDSNDALGWSSEPGWAQVNELLQTGIAYARTGSTASPELADRLCSETPTPKASQRTGKTWACVLREPPRLSNRDLTLEFDEHGLFALTSFGYAQKEARRLSTTARAQWASWCAGSNFTEVETVGTQAFFRCTLKDGPTLVIGRFPSDAEADMWQISFAIIGHGG